MRIGDVMAARAQSRKRSVNLSVRADLVEEAKELGTNMSAVLERALDEEHREQRRKVWREENRPAIEKWNDWVEDNGIPFEDLRPW